MLIGPTVRRVAIIGGSRIPFARGMGAFAGVGNQEMLTAAMRGLVERYGLLGARLGDVAAGAVIATGVMNLPAIVIIGLVTLLLVRGVSESATVNNIIVAIKLTVVVAFIAIGSRYVHPAHWSPLVPAEIPARPPGPCAISRASRSP